MTVSYTAEVATCKGFGCFLKLLFRWRGSIYKLVWPDLLVFLGCYFSLSILYRLFLTPEQQIVFEKIARYCEQYGNLIPVSFVLGFYVSIVVGRWWSQYQAIPSPDSTAVFVSANIHGQDEKSRIMRRTIMRYCCLASTMCFTLISPRVKKRFPTLDHLVEAGLLLENEKEVMDALNRKHGHPKHWLPIVWACSIVTRARKEGKIRDDFAVKTILDELNKIRTKMGTLIQYDWISVPLVYTQVVTLAVYSFFFACVMGRQWIKPEGKIPCTDPRKCGGEIDLIFPMFTTLQFFFYMGWLKVAESLVNPFGNDDDDFELNWMIDRNLQVSYLIVDEMHHEHPELLKDQYWDSVLPTELPHTIASEQYREIPPSHSTANLFVSYQDGEIVSPPSIKSIHRMSEYAEPGRRISMTPSAKYPGGSFFRRGRTGSVRSTTSQSTLGGGDQMSRAGSIASVFKRMISRESHRDRDRGDPQSQSQPSPGAHDGGGPPLSWVGSSVNMRNVAEEVIPELDENMVTIISLRGGEKKPTVHDVFGTTTTTTGTSSPPGTSTSTGPQGHRAGEKEKDVKEHQGEGEGDRSVSREQEQTSSSIPIIPPPNFTRSVTVPVALEHEEPGEEPPSSLILSTSAPVQKPKFTLFPVTPPSEMGIEMQPFLQPRASLYSKSEPEALYEAALDSSSKSQQGIAGSSSSMKRSSISSENIGKKFAKKSFRPEKEKEGEQERLLRSDTMETDVGESSRDKEDEGGTSTNK